MRSRNIKPGFFINEDLAEVDPFGRLLFVGLWCLADRDGKLEDRAKRIKGELFRFDDLSTEQVDDLLTKLNGLGLIQRYEVDGDKYIIILKFSLHQRPHYNEKPSVIPDPLATKVASTCDQGSKCLSPRQKALRPDSLIPDSQNKNPPTPPAGGNGCETDFGLWWEEAPGPMKIGKEVAARDWGRLKRRGKLRPLPEMLAVLRRQKESEAWQREEGRFIPLASAYLRKFRFQDESVSAREPPWECRECRGAGFRKGRPGEAAMGGVVRCECQAAEEARGP